MKFVFDVDGVISEVPAYFSAVTKSLISVGHEVYIVSDYDENFRRQREKELADWGIEYTAFIITADKMAFFVENDIDFALDDEIQEYYPKARFLMLGIVGKEKFHEKPSK